MGEFGWNSAGRLGILPNLGRTLPNVGRPHVDTRYPFRYTEPMTIRTGNVVDSPTGSRWIVTAVNCTSIAAVSFDHPNVSCSQPRQDEITSRYNVTDDTWYEDFTLGWDAHATVLAESVRAFITQRLWRAFESPRSSSLSMKRESDQ